MRVPASSWRSRCPRAASSCSAGTSPSIRRRDAVGGPGRSSSSSIRAAPGTEWLGNARAHEFLDVIGPLGKGFAYPKRLTNCLLVAEGHGAASLYFLAQELIARHKRVDMIVGGETLETRLQADRGQAPVADDPDRHGRRQPGRARLGDGCPAGDGRQVRGAGAVRSRHPRRRWSASRGSAASDRSPPRCRSRSGWRAGTASASRAWCPWRGRTAAATTTCGRASTVPVFNPARVLWDRWLSDAPTMLPTPPEGLPVVRSWPG